TKNDDDFKRATMKRIKATKTKAKVTSLKEYQNDDALKFISRFQNVDFKATTKWTEAKKFEAKIKTQKMKTSLKETPKTTVHRNLQQGSKRATPKATTPLNNMKLTKAKK
ncbi:2899_t:CDS:2, partial [Dentiscutata erythropus]